MPTLPFSEFLDALRDRGLGVGLHEYVAAGRLLDRWNETNRDELRNSLAALVARDEDEVRAIRALFEEFYPGDEADPDVTPVRSRPRRVWSVSLAGNPALWAAAVLVVALAAASTLAWQRLQRQAWPAVTSPLEPPVAAVARPIPGTTRFETSLDASIAEPPAVNLPAPPTRLDRRMLASLGVGAFALVVLPLWARRMRAATRTWTRHAWSAALAALPGPFHGSFVLKDLETRLPRADIEEAATILGRSSRTPTTDQRSGKLDVERSLRRTLAAGMQPHLVFRPRQVVRPILVLQDVSQPMRVHARRVDGLCRDLGRQGIALERWFFEGDVARVSPRRHGAGTPLEAVLRRRHEGPVLILSTGHRAAASLASADQEWASALRRQSRRAWVNPVPDPALWPAALQRVPAPVVSLTRAGLLQAARWLTQDDRTAFRQVSRAPRVVTDDHVRQLRRLASLVPHPTVDVLELLRQRFAPEIPESAVLHTVGHGTLSGDAPFRMTDDEIRSLLAEIRATQPALERRVREYLLKVLEDSRPSAGSAAFQRWEAARALQQVPLAELSGRDASTALQTLRRLRQGPLWEEVGEMIARLPPTGRVTTPLRASAVAGGHETAPPGFRGHVTGAPPAPFHWRAPGWRAAALATAAATLVVGAAAASRAVVLATEHRHNAYFLDYVEPQGANPGVLRIRKNPAMPDVPDSVQVYGNASSPISSITLAGDPVTIPIPPSSRAVVYQVRAPLPTGALALSNTTWAPALLVVIDARPWAHVTLSSAGAGVAPFTQTTPFRIRLPAGTYQVELRSDDSAAAPATDTMVVAATGPREFSFTMPGFDLDRALERLGVKAARPRAAR